MTDTFGDRIKGYAKQTLETVFHPANAISRACTSHTLAQIEAKLQVAAKSADRAKGILSFTNCIGLLGEAEENLKKGVEKIDQWLSIGNDVTGDVTAGCKIFEAVGVLEDWSARRNSVTDRDAAAAFDRLFDGISTYFGLLPFPGAKEYAHFISEWAKRHMFSKLERELEFQGGNQTPAWDSVNKELGQ